MIGNTHSIYLILSMLTVLALVVFKVVQASQPAAMYPEIIEVFTITDSPITSEVSKDKGHEFGEKEFHIYKLDGISKLESVLSNNLSADQEQSKQTVLLRIQHLDQSANTNIQHSAFGLAKAIQYGLNRYPAIVFNNNAVVYGITDLEVAINLYQTWQARMPQ